MWHAPVFGWHVPELLAMGVGLFCSSARRRSLTPPKPTTEGLPLFRAPAVSSLRDSFTSPLAGLAIECEPSSWGDAPGYTPSPLRGWGILVPEGRRRVAAGFNPRNDRLTTQRSKLLVSMQAAVC